MTAPDWMSYLAAAKTALDVIKGIRSELPKGPEADNAQQQIENAESALKTSEVELAKSGLNQESSRSWQKSKRISKTICDSQTMVRVKKSKNKATHYTKI